jgi:hypothetical protein
MEDEKETMPLGAPRSKLASNDMHQTLMGHALFSTFGTKTKETIEI